MGEEVTLEGDPPIQLVLKPSARARRLSLRVSQLDGRVTLTLPHGASRRHAIAFAQGRADWIRRHLDRRPDEIRPLPGGRIMYRGEDCAIEAAPGRSVRYADGRLLVPERGSERTPARLAAFLKQHARFALIAAAGRHAERLGAAHGKITLRDTRSRWGSCTTRGDLMFSWRLIMAPPEVLDYVAAHEVAHLIEMNHSDAYWAVVARTCPGFAAPRRWLKDNAPALHRYRFRD